MSTSNAQGPVAYNWCSQRIGSKKGFTMASLNVKVLRGYLDQLKILMNDMGIDKLALNETKLDCSIDQNITEIAGYGQQRLDRSSFGGSVSIYVRDTIKFHARKDIPNDNLEILSIEVQSPKSRPILVVAWYRSPSDPVSTFDKAEKFLSSFVKESKEIILMGETNCDLSSGSHDGNCRCIQNLSQLFSFEQLIDKPSRITLTSSILIYNIETTSIDDILESGLRKISLSDHFMVFCKRKLNATVGGGHKLVKHKSPAMMSCYKKARNAVNNLNVSLKKQYFNNKIIEHKGNMKETWKINNELFNKRSKSTNITSLKDWDVEIGGKREISNVVNC